MAYIVIQFPNGKFGVKDTRPGVALPVVSAGMTREQATTWAARLNLRAAWGK